MSDERAASFCFRRNRNLTSLKLETSIDVRFCFVYRVVTWREHLTRHKELPAYSFLISETDERLREQGTRLVVLESLGTPRREQQTLTLTQDFLCVGGLGWLEAMTSRAGGWENARRSKATSKERAQLLVDFVLKKVSRERLALDDGIV